VSVHHGDCLEVMAGMEPESIDAIVTDPPYDLLSTGARNGSRRINNPDNPAGRGSRGFMGKAWDGTGIAFRPETWAACLRVAKPSAYLLAFGGTRTVHRMTCAIEDAGWIVRDMLVWAYASGFPKSKASLKPAWEPIVMARKPGPLRMLAIDECRIPLTGAEAVDDREGEATADTRYGDKVRAKPGRRLISNRPGGPAVTAYGDGLSGSYADGATTLGRWPANVILTDPIFDGGWDGVVGGGETSSGSREGTYAVTGYSKGWGDTSRTLDGDSGTYSRFFLIPKADRADREPLLSVLPLRPGGSMRGAETRPDRPTNHPHRRNIHPTVKPVDLMRHLVRLVTPTGGTVLDPFLGSGTTGLAAEMEGFEWIGIEREAEYVAIAEARLNGTQRGMAL
jgi:site-specific DNA-methyltransferase (adenine-specific)